MALREADIDLVVLGVGPECSTLGGGFNKSDRTELVGILRKIGRQLRRERVVARAQGIYTAKVPIVKAHTTGDDATGFALDLTVGATNGLKAVDWIKARVEEFPELRPLVLVLKKLLKTHSLDDASTGGCGGYLLVSLAVAHLRMRGASGGARENVSGGKKVAVLPPPPKVDLGVVVTSFLRRFGGDGFDYARSAVAANRSSGLARAAELVVTPGPYGKRPFILCEDPQEVGRNITASAYRFKEVRALFRAAAEAIAAGGDLTFLPEMADGRPNAPARAGGAASSSEAAASAAGSGGKVFRSVDFFLSRDVRAARSLNDPIKPGGRLLRIRSALSFARDAASSSARARSSARSFSTPVLVAAHALISRARLRARKPRTRDCSVTAAASSAETAAREL